MSISAAVKRGVPRRVDARIDAYLVQVPLSSGYGKAFAEAAWETGMDPRWSPAISNTESSKGRNCFSPTTLGDGIRPKLVDLGRRPSRSHVAGLARGYGYTISLYYAMKYCPPNYHNWYRDTLNQMQLI